MLASVCGVRSIPRENPPLFRVACWRVLAVRGADLGRFSHAVEWRVTAMQRLISAGPMSYSSRDDERATGVLELNVKGRGHAPIST